MLYDFRGNSNDTNVYQFDRSNCERTHGPNVTNQLQEEKRSRAEMATALNIGDWVLFDSKMEDEPIWLGRVMSNPEWWEGMGILLNNTRRKRTYDNGVEIGVNEVAIFVQWYEKIDINSDALEYHVSRTITKPAVQSNEYMVFSGFEMHRVVGGSNPVPKRRNTNTARRGQYDRIREDIHKTFNEWHDKEFGLIWKMNNDVRRKALARCGMWR